MQMRQSYYKTPRATMMEDHHENPIREAWILCLILGLIMINFPFIHIFNNEELIFGIPGLILYFFIGWPASIFVIYLFVHQINRSTKTQSKSKDETGL